MASMRLGGVISFLGAILVLGLTAYYITLPADAAPKIFLGKTFLGLSYLLYFAIAGSIITITGLLMFIKAARSIEAIAEPGVVVRRPAAPARARLTRPREGGEINVEKGGIVEEIEREIEEIVKSGEEVAKEKLEGKEVGEEAVVEAVKVEVITRGTDMVCPSCGAINPLKSEKCLSCKKPLFVIKGEEEVCPVCGAPLRLARKISDELFVCGLCFSELRIPSTLQEKVGLT